VYLAEDCQTLFIHRRLDVLPEYDYRIEPHGRYVRLRADEERAESLSFTVPVYAELVYADRRRLQSNEPARRLAIEIGYYDGDLPGLVYGILTEAERLTDSKLDYKQELELINRCYFGGLIIREFFGGLMGFNEVNEDLMRSRDEEVLIPYSNQALKFEQVLRITVDGVHIPYEEKQLRRYPPDLQTCTRVEIQYQPSALEYFFPYASQQSLMDPSEIQHLRSLKTIVVKNQEHLKALAEDVSKVDQTGIVAERNTAHVTCYRDDKRMTSFTVCDNMSIKTEENAWFEYYRGLQSLKMLTPHIQPFDLRVSCAANLKNLWHRLYLYHRAEKERLKDSSSKSKIVYPIPTEWCDALERAYRPVKAIVYPIPERYYALGQAHQTVSADDEFIMSPYMCRSAGEGKCHYAMNPNCKYDSSPDMVLLFETKAGWNQHGGPELFTFDNHDPKGGCVLLNDGTVKFIRTKEELQQLRWK